MKEAAWKAGNGSFRTGDGSCLNAKLVFGLLVWSRGQEASVPVVGRRRRFSAAAAEESPMGLEFSPSMGRFRLGQSITRISDTCLRLSPCIWRCRGGRWVGAS